MQTRFSPAFLMQKSIKEKNEKQKIANEKWLKSLKSRESAMNPRIKEYLTLLSDLQSKGIK